MFVGPCGSDPFERALRRRHRAPRDRAPRSRRPPRGRPTTGGDACCVPVPGGAAVSADDSALPVRSSHRRASFVPHVPQRAGGGSRPRAVPRAPRTRRTHPSSRPRTRCADERAAASRLPPARADSGEPPRTRVAGDATRSRARGLRHCCRSGLGRVGVAADRLRFDGACPRSARSPQHRRRAGRVERREWNLRRHATRTRYDTRGVLRVRLDDHRRGRRGDATGARSARSCARLRRRPRRPERFGDRDRRRRPRSRDGVGRHCDRRGARCRRRGGVVDSPPDSASTDHSQPDLARIRTGAWRRSTKQKRVGSSGANVWWRS